jgi:N-formylglutamate deformylase
VQLEMTQCSYMEEVWPFTYRPDRAQAVQPHLRHMLEAVLDFVKKHDLKLTADPRSPVSRAVDRM